MLTKTTRLSQPQNKQVTVKAMQLLYINNVVDSGWVSRSISPRWNHKAAMHGLWEAPGCSAGIAINQPTTPSRDIKTTTSHHYHHQITLRNGHGNTQVKVSSTPIPKDLPPLLRARAVALSGKSVGVNIGRKCWGYRDWIGEQQRV